VTRTPPAARPILRIAHRGASRHAPENTLAAFDLAIRQGIDAIELDVRLTRDGVPVVLHDDRLDRTTDGRGPIGATPFESVRRLDAGSWFAPRFRGERVPTLAEALDCAGDRCGVNIEIKTASGRDRSPLTGRSGSRCEVEGLAGAVAREVRRARFSRLLVVSSFSRTALAAVRAHLPRARLGLLASRSARGMVPAHRALRLFSLHPHVRLVSRRRLAAARRLGLCVLVWPVNDAATLRRLVARGVDGIMTDDPLLFRGLHPVPAPGRRRRRSGS
jgi:glycerophosphoryl diester phosphodiesterase